MIKKYYVVWRGREVGVFNTWAKCKAQTDSFSGAKYKSYPSLDEAESAFGAESKNKQVTDSEITNKNKKKKSISLSQQQINDMPFDVKIFTDGACVPNPGEAGTGLVAYENNTLSELWYGLYQSFGTNNTAELHGLNQALLLAREKLLSGFTIGIFCDSKYSIDCITKWAKGWEKKSWSKSGDEIKNLDIIKPAYTLYKEISSKITIHHVNGHVGIEGNELADRMSLVAIESKDVNFCLFREPFDIAEILA